MSQRVSRRRKKRRLGSRIVGSRVERFFKELLRRARLEREGIRLVIKPYKVYGGRIDMKKKELRLAEDVALYYPDDLLRHIIAHELAHYILYKQGHDLLTNRLHGYSFYKVLAQIAGYKSPEEAMKYDTMANLYVYELIKQGKIKV